MQRIDASRGTGVRRAGRTVLVAGSILLGAVALQACGADRPAGEAADGPPRVGVELDLRIDGYETDLVPVDALHVLSDGTMAVFQRQDHSIRYFDATGEPLGSVGRRGEGPGEFMRVIRGGLLGDTLWISDTQLDRVTLIAPDLEVVRTLPPLRVRSAPGGDERLGEFRSGYPYAMYPGDTLLVSVTITSADPQASMFDGNPLLRTSSDGEIERIVFERPESSEAGYIFITYDGGSAGARVPFYPQPRWVVSSDGRRIASLTTSLDASGATVRLTVVDDLGETVIDRAYPFEPEPIPESVADSAVAALSEARSSNAALRRAIDSDLKGMIPPVYPPVVDMLAGVDGRIWLGLRPTDEGNPWLVLAPDGEPEMRLVLPSNVSIEAADGEYFWGTERDEFDVESIVRYRITRGQP